MKKKKNSPATPAASLQIVLTGNNRERDINQIQTTYKIQPNLIWHQNSEPKISPPTYKFQTPTLSYNVRAKKAFTSRNKRLSALFQLLKMWAFQPCPPSLLLLALLRVVRFPKTISSFLEVKTFFREMGVVGHVLNSWHCPTPPRQEFF